MQIMTISVEETVALGQLIGTLAPPNTCIALHGNLGAGKTQLTRGIALGARVDDPSLVSSPTYVLLNIYSGQKPVFHMDAYRVASEDDFSVVGFDELLFGGGVVVMEWAERVVHLLPSDRMEIAMEVGEEEGHRVLHINGMGAMSEELARKIAVGWEQRAV